MPDQALHDLVLIGGPFAVGGALIGFAFVKRWIVPGWAFDQEHVSRIASDARADRAIAGWDKTVKALDRLSGVVKALGGQ